MNRIGWATPAILSLGVALYISDHRRWMVRNFSLSLAAVTLRIYIPLSVVAGVDFSAAYVAIAWLCWVPNLLMAEIWLNRAPTALPRAAGFEGL